jgi:dienelactone hydrolase
MSPDVSAVRREELQALLAGGPSVGFRVARQEIVNPGWPEARAFRLALASEAGEVRAFLTGPAGAWRGLPAVLYIHAHGNRYAVGADELLEGRPALLQPPYGRALAATGIVALSIDLPSFGARSNLSEPALAKALLWRGRTLFGQMLAELAGALRLLGGIDGVDAGRIGVMGLSMGATLSYWLAALEPRVRATAHLCCFADLETLIDSGAHDLHGPYMTVPGLVGRFSTGEIAGLVAPRPQLVCVGTDDPLTPPAALARGLEDLRAAYATFGATQHLETVVAEGGGHAETPAMRRAVLAFLAARL